MFNNTSVKVKLLIVSAFFVTISSLIMAIEAYFYTKDLSLKYEFHSIQNNLENKKNRMQTYFNTKKLELDTMSKSLLVKNFAIDLEETEDELKLSDKDKYPYENKDVVAIADYYHPYLSKILKNNAYYDILILNPKNGRVMYSVTKEADLGENLKHSSLSKSGLAKAWEQAVQNNEVSFSDLSPYAPSNGDPALFLAQTILSDDVVIGVLAIHLDISKINDIMLSGHSLDDTESAYLVGNDYLMRSDHKRLKSHSIKASFANPNLGTMQTKAIEYALNKKQGFMLNDRLDEQYQTAYGYIDLGNDVRWAIISEASKDSIFSRINKIFISLGVSVLFIIVIVNVLMAMIVRKIIIQPLSTIMDGLKMFFDFLSGKLDNAVQIDMKTGDEFGEIAHNINARILKINEGLKKDKQFILNLKSVSNEVKNGRLGSRVEENADNPNLLELKDILNDMIDTLQKSLNDSMKVLSLYSAKDYTNFVNSNISHGDLKKLGDDVNSVGGVVSSILTSNENNAVLLNDLSAKLETNMDNLKGSSNSQQESTESIKKLIANISSNIYTSSSNISQMDSFAQESKQTSVIGKGLAIDISTSMDNINKKIATISKELLSIDKITFQTKILSLNAAVEAATAGDNGKGFAVVAGEVRNLAGKSSSVANDIKLFVLDATKEANKGSLIAKNMMDRFQELEEKIDNTVILIERVVKYSQEQLSSIVGIESSIDTLVSLSEKNTNIVSDTNNISNNMQDLSGKIQEDMKDKTFNKVETTTHV